MRTPNPRRLALLVLATAALGLAAALPLRFSLERTPEAEVRARIADLRREGLLGVGAPAAVGVPADAREFARRLAAFDELLLSDGIGSLPVGSYRPELRDRMRWLGPLVAELEELLGGEACRAALARGVSLAAAADGARSPDVDAVRRWTNLLCSRALLDAEGGEDPLAIARLGRAFDLAWLVDDGTATGYEVRWEAEWIATWTTRRVVLDDLLDVAELRRAIDPRLVRSVEDARLIDCARYETELWLASAEEEVTTEPAEVPGLAPDLARPVRVEDAFERLDEYERIAEGGRPCEGGFPPYREDGPPVQQTLRRWHPTEIQVHQARVALALAEHRQETGEWPSDLTELAPRFGGTLPANACDARPVVLAFEDGEVRLGTPLRRGAARAGEGEDEETLSLWVWR